MGTNAILEKDQDQEIQNDGIEVPGEWKELIEEEAVMASPVHQDRLFLVMWQSRRSGGTYSQLRKSVQGKNRFLRGLMLMGVNLSEIQVIEQKKAWVPDKKEKPAAAGTRRGQRQHERSRDAWQSKNIH